MQRIGNLNWENITYDHDISGLMRGLIDWGVIEGGTVVGNKLQPVQAIIPLVRSNGQKILAFFESDEVIDLPTTGDYKVYIEVDQSKIDFGGNNAEDGTGIASIKTWPSVPSQNFLLLASVTAGQVKDERNLIPKVGQIAQRTTTLEEKVSQAEEKVGKLEEAGTPSYLGITGIVWEKYTMQDTLFLQKAPTLTDSILPLNVWDTNTNKEQHIQRISSGVASNQLKLKMDKVLSPTSSVVIEVRKGIKVDVNEKEAYWYGGWEVLATATLPYTKFNTEAQEITVDLNKSFQLPKGNLYSVVVMQQGGIVNANNYYRIYCDGTQWSEAFSAVAVNGNNRTRGKLMPYCASEGFTPQLFSKMWENQKFSIEEQLSTNFTVGTTNGAKKITDYKIPFKGLVTVSPHITSDKDSYYSYFLRMVWVVADGTKFSCWSFYNTTAYESFWFPRPYNPSSINVRPQNPNIEIWGMCSVEYNDRILKVPYIDVTTSAELTKIGLGVRPRSLSWVWESIITTGEWLHTDGQWIGPAHTMTSVITGNISLGNAVWFKTDYLSDWTVVLVPYYNLPW